MACVSPTFTFLWEISRSFPLKTFLRGKKKIKYIYIYFYYESGIKIFLEFY